MESLSKKFETSLSFHRAVIERTRFNSGTIEGFISHLQDSMCTPNPLIIPTFDQIESANGNKYSALFEPHKSMGINCANYIVMLSILIYENRLNVVSLRWGLRHEPPPNPIIHAAARIITADNHEFFTEFKRQKTPVFRLHPYSPVANGYEYTNVEVVPEGSLLGADLLLCRMEKLCTGTSGSQRDKTKHRNHGTHPAY